MASGPDGVPNALETSVPTEEHTGASLRERPGAVNTPAGQKGASHSRGCCPRKMCASGCSQAGSHLVPQNLGQKPLWQGAHSTLPQMGNPWASRRASQRGQSGRPKHSPVSGGKSTASIGQTRPQETWPASCRGHPSHLSASLVQASPVTTAQALMPRSSPVKPRPSSVVAFTLTLDGSSSRRAATLWRMVSL